MNLADMRDENECSEAVHSYKFDSVTKPHDLHEQVGKFVSFNAPTFQPANLSTTSLHPPHDTL